MKNEDILMQQLFSEEKFLEFIKEKENQEIREYFLNLVKEEEIKILQQEEIQFQIDQNL